MSKEIEQSTTDVIQGYVDWKNDMRFREGDYSPQRYEEHLYNLRNQAIIDKAIAMVDKYNIGGGWNDEMINIFGDLLKSNK